MATAISSTYRPLRAILGDRSRDAQFQRYTDAALEDAVQAAITLQKISGATLTPDETAIEPELTATQFAILLLETARLFLLGDPRMAAGSIRTRALGQTWGANRDLLVGIEEDLHKLVHGETALLGWADFVPWLTGYGTDALEGYTSETGQWSISFDRNAAGNITGLVARIIA